MLWFFGLLTTCILAVGGICFGMASYGAIVDRTNDDYGANGMLGLGMALCAAVLFAGAVAGLIALRSN
ncbi:MAG: hypothetical protein ACREA9_23245 [Pyrinomonadaceae bacterium]